MRNRRTSMFESPAIGSAIEEEEQGSENRSRASRSSPPQNRRVRYTGLFGAIDPVSYESPLQRRPPGRRGNRNLRNFFDAPSPLYEARDITLDNELGSTFLPQINTQQSDFGGGDRNEGLSLEQTPSLQQFMIDLGEHQSAYPETQNDFMRLQDFVEDTELGINPSGPNRARRLDLTGGLGEYRVWEEAKEEESEDNSGRMDEETD
ncbi:hypothetical protein Dda_3757 [Drechslerella dactyloides]|uniref:Uncharacterized protein n=1 Tax=Drechslerella dactyloides TaxID=74499 RepID=A0AAD6IZC4_DREDA|nr:hypothetical protein Dda_3757 [Drechslerella dactyloides]